MKTEEQIMLKQKRDTEVLELELNRALLKLLDTDCANTGVSRTMAVEKLLLKQLEAYFQGHKRHNDHHGGTVVF